MLTLDQKKLIRSAPIKSIVGAYESGNEAVLDYALSVAKPSEKIKARQKAVFMGLDVDFQASDVGEEMRR